LIKAVVNRITNPSKSPFTKGDFISPFEKGGRGIFGQTGLVKINLLQ
jgi:hypothetical protein